MVLAGYDTAFLYMFMIRKFYYIFGTDPMKCKFLLILLFLGLGAFAYAADIDISSCGILSLSGNYLLTGNLSTNGTCFTITANDVDLNLNGFVLNGDDGDDDAGLSVLNKNNITVHSGFISDFGNGVKYQSVTNSSVANLTLSSNAVGVQFITTSSSTINSNTIDRSIIGIYLNTLSINNTIANNSLDNASFAQIRVLNSDNNTVVSNTVQDHSDTAYRGILNTLSNNTIISNNSVYDLRWSCGFGCGTAGIILEDSRNLTVSNNNIHDTSSLGVYYTNMHNSTISNNILYNNDYAGLLQYDNANFNITITNNIAFNNSNSGFEILGGNITFLGGNTAYNNSNGFLINITNGTTTSGNLIYQNVIGIFILNSDNTTISDHFYNNSLDFRASELQNENKTFTLSNAIFDNPLGNIANYTNISIFDNAFSNNNYTMTWSPNPLSSPSKGTSFAQKFIDIGSSQASSSVVIIWHWLDSESLSNNESNFYIYSYDSSLSKWIDESADLDSENNTLTLSNLDRGGVFGIFEVKPSIPASGSKNVKLGISAKLESSCDKNLLSISSEVKALHEANVFVNGNPLNNKTDSNGKISFSYACGQTVTIKVAKAGYTTFTDDFETIICNICASSQCNSNADCSSNEQCSNGMCKPVNCNCGAVNNHQCVAYQCCSDLQCGTNQMCSSNICVDKTECSMDKECSDSQSCVSGKCTELSGACGQAINHKFVDFECGVNPNCPPCSSGSICSENYCKRIFIVCGNTSTYGVICNVTMGNVACIACDYEITYPDGKRAIGKTDERGILGVSFEAGGKYIISIVQGAQTVQSLTLDITSPSTQDQKLKNSDLGLIFAATFGLIAIYFFYIKKVSKLTKE